MTHNNKTVSLKKVEDLCGFVVNWLLCGPFNEECKVSSCRALQKDYLSVTGGERNVKPRAGMRGAVSGPVWQAYAVRYGFIVNLARRYSIPGIVSYAVAYLDSPHAQSATILLGSDDGFKLYLNHERIGYRDVHRGLGVDSDRFDVNLKKGVNIVLLKIEQAFGAYEFCLRVTDPKGRALPGLRAYLDHPRVRKPVDPAKLRTISAYDYLSHRFARAEMKLTFQATTKLQYVKWRTKFLAHFGNLLGRFPDRCPLKPEVTDDVPFENFRRKRVLIDMEPGFSVPCIVTIPKRIVKGGKLPAVLCLHGHDAGKRDMIGDRLGTDQEAPWNKPIAMALHAARRGYVTISPDFLAFGERLESTNAYGVGRDPCQAEFVWAQMAGVLPTNINIWTVKRCIDYLGLLPEVDGARIGVMGHSLGGYMATLAAAMEPRIKAVVISGFMMTMAGFHGRPWLCGSMVVGNLLSIGDQSDLACTLAPRPTLIITGEYDSCTSFPFAVTAFKKIKRAFELMSVPQQVHHFTFPGDHVFQPDAALDWLDKWLRNVVSSRSTLEPRS